MITKFIIRNLLNLLVFVLMVHCSLASARVSGYNWTDSSGLVRSIDSSKPTYQQYVNGPGLEFDSTTEILRCTNCSLARRNSKVKCGVRKGLPIDVKIHSLLEGSIYLTNDALIQGHQANLRYGSALLTFNVNSGPQQCRDFEYDESLEEVMTKVCAQTNAKASCRTNKFKDITRFKIPIEWVSLEDLRECKGVNAVMNENQPIRSQSLAAITKEIYSGDDSIDIKSARYKLMKISSCKLRQEPTTNDYYYPQPTREPTTNNYYYPQPTPEPTTNNYYYPQPTLEVVLKKDSSMVDEDSDYAIIWDKQHPFTDLVLHKQFYPTMSLATIIPQDQLLVAE